MVPVDSKRLFAAVVFVAAVVVLALQLINPSPVLVEIGENGSESVQIGKHYTEGDVAIVTLAACLVGASATYLLTAASADRPPTQATARQSREPSGERRTAVAGDETAATDGTGGSVSSVESGAHGDPGERDPAPSEQLLEVRKQEWEETADRLANKERDVYEAVLEADGVLPQSDIVDRTELSKASVSRALDGLEAKQLLERKRRGMGNVVILQ